MKTLILQHRIVRIELENGQHHVFIKLSHGTAWIRHNPFSGDLRGLVAAMTLATDCLAGKFFPMGVVTLPEEKKPRNKELEAPKPDVIEPQYSTE